MKPPTASITASGALASQPAPSNGVFDAPLDPLGRQSRRPSLQTTAPAVLLQPLGRRWLTVCGAALLLGAALGQVAAPVVGMLPQAWVGAALGALVGLGLGLCLWLYTSVLARSQPRPQPGAQQVRGSSDSLARALAQASQDMAMTPPASSPALSPSPSLPAPAAAQVAQPNPQRLARDPLTGAFTQQYFVAAADREWARLRRHGEDAALLMVDIDRFARLNDTHGLAFSDAMLIEVTRLTSATLRPYDLMARFGGGVLVVYLPHTDPMGALDVAERIRERIAGLRLTQDAKTASSTVSVGVAPIGEGHASLEAVITDAGIALRDAKAAGRNCVRSAPIPPRKSSQPGAPLGDRRPAGPF